MPWEERASSIGVPHDDLMPTDDDILTPMNDGPPPIRPTFNGTSADEGPISANFYQYIYLGAGSDIAALTYNFQASENHPSTIYGGNGAGDRDRFIYTNALSSTATMLVDLETAEVRFNGDRAAYLYEIEDVTVTSSGSMTIKGNAAGNVLNADGTGAGAIYGRGGNDTLNGAAGDDVLNGGAGNDVFDFDRVANGGDDTITDFSRVAGNRDRIDLREWNFDSVDDFMHFAVNGTTYMYLYDGQELSTVIVLQGVDSIGNSDFIF